MPSPDGWPSAEAARSAIPAAAVGDVGLETEEASPVASAALQVSPAGNRMHEACAVKWEASDEACAQHLLPHLPP